MSQLDPITTEPRGGGSGRRAEDAARSLRADGLVLLPADFQADLIGAAPESWERFDRHWDDLTLDTYMRDGGTYRYRRYGRYAFDADAGTLTRLPHTTYRQSTSVNPLNGGIDRQFDPLTDAFAADPLVPGLIRTLGEIITAATGGRRWNVELHPFRVVTSENETGRPAPQGRHRDGVTFVTSLVVGRRNVTGGESSVYTDDGDRRAAVTLGPGDQLLLDDRRLLHDVTPVVPRDPARPSHRDVLIIDFTIPGAEHAAEY